MLDWYLIAKQMKFGSPAEMLTTLYVDMKMPVDEIAKKIGCSHWSVLHALRYHGIGVRRHGGFRQRRRR